MPHGVALLDESDTRKKRIAMKITCYQCNTDFVVPEGVSLDENLCPGCDAFKALLAACEEMADWIASKGSRPPCVKRANAAIAKAETLE